MQHKSGCQTIINHDQRKTRSSFTTTVACFTFCSVTQLTIFLSAQVKVTLHFPIVFPPSYSGCVCVHFYRSTTISSTTTQYKKMNFNYTNDGDCFILCLFIVCDDRRRRRVTAVCLLIKCRQMDVPDGRSSPLLAPQSIIVFIVYFLALLFTFFARFSLPGVYCFT